MWLEEEEAEAPWRPESSAPCWPAEGSGATDGGPGVDAAFFTAFLEPSEAAGAALSSYSFLLTVPLV